MTNCGDKENLSDVLPSLLQQFAPVGRVPENCPEERPSILMCVSQPGTNRENRCNRGLMNRRFIGPVHRELRFSHILAKMSFMP